MALSSTSAQARQRAPLASSTLSPSVASTSMHGSRPLRSSPLAGPAFSTLPSIISESSEESHDDALGEHSHRHARSPTSSIVSHSPSASGSGYGTGYTSGNGSVSALEGEASTSSFSVNGNGIPSSQGHCNGHNHRAPPSRLSKSTGAVPTLGFFRRAAATTIPQSTETLMSTQPAIPPPALTNAHGHFRSASLPSRPLSPTQQRAIPQTYSPGSSRPTSPTATLVSNHSSHREHQKPRPSTSRDPTSNWLTSSPFGPAETPRFSRLALASPAVVMPLSAREYRKRKSGGAHANGKEKDRSVSTNHVSFVDSTRKHASMPLPASLGMSSSTETARPASTGPEGQSRLRPTSPSPAATSERKTRPSSPTPAKRPPSPQQPRSRPTTLRHPSYPEVPHSLSPKSSANTFFSIASSSSSESEVAFPSKNTDDNSATRDPVANEEIDYASLPPARPRLRPRRNRSFPDRRSGGARLSLVDAMNRLSQEGTPNRLSVASRTDSLNRLSVLSQASGNTVFYDLFDVENQNQENTPTETTNQKNPVPLRTQSLEDLPLAGTKLETTARDTDKSRSARTVRISENIDTMGQPTSPRRRKLTKSRPKPAPLRTLNSPSRASTILPRISRGLVVDKGSAEGRLDEEVRGALSSGATVTESQADGEAGPKSSGDDLSPIAEVSTTHEDECLSANNTVSSSKNPVSDTGERLTETHSRKGRRYTFQIIPAPSFHRTRRDKARSVSDPPNPPPRTESDRGRKLAKPKRKGGTESRTSTESVNTATGRPDIVGTSVRSVGCPDTPSLERPSNPSTDTVSPHVQRSTCETNGNAEGLAFSHSFGTTGRGSTPSLTPSGSTMTTSSSTTATVPSFVRHPADPFVPRPSQLKECLTDTSHDDGGVNVCRTRDAVHPAATLASTKPHICASPRPGSSGSSSTTATATSYASLSTIAASARSSSPSVVKEQVQPLQLETSQELRPCALCGHPAPMVKPHGGFPDDLHPMFTVPLVTITASSTSQVRLDRIHPAATRASSQSTAAVFLPASKSSGKSSTNSKAHDLLSPNSIKPSFPASFSTHTGPDIHPVPITSSTDTSPTLPARRKRARPQTAPAGTGDTALKFAEAAWAREVTEVRVTDGYEVRRGRGSKTSGESKLRALLRNWLGKA